MEEVGMFSGDIKHVVLKEIKTYTEEQVLALSDEKLSEAAADAVRALRYLSVADMHISDDDDPDAGWKYGQKVRETVKRLNPVLIENARRFQERNAQLEPADIPKWPAEGVPEPLEDLLLQEADQELAVAKMEWAEQVKGAHTAIAVAHEMIQERKTRLSGKVKLEEAQVALEELNIEMNEALDPLREVARQEKLRAIGERIDLALPTIEMLRIKQLELTEELLRARNDWYEVRSQAESTRSGTNLAVPGDTYRNLVRHIVRALEDPIASKTAQGIKSLRSAR